MSEYSNLLDNVFLFWSSSSTSLEILDVQLNASAWTAWRLTGYMNDGQRIIGMQAEVSYLKIVDGWMVVGGRRGCFMVIIIIETELGRLSVPP